MYEPAGIAQVAVPGWMQRRSFSPSPPDALPDFLIPCPSLIFSWTFDTNYGKYRSG